MTASTAAPARDEAVEPATPRHFGLDAVLVGLVVALGIVLRFATTSDLWFDEALSVNIAELPLSELGDALRQDGAPPLFYGLLHFWVELFGSGDIAVRAFSGLVSVATLPLAYLAGKRIGGRAVAWWSVMILAASPYAIRYATESRMYALVMFLVLWGYLALRRALDKPSVGRLAVVALVTALLVYTQYWSFYVLAIVGVGLLLAWWKGSAPTRPAAPRIIAAMVVGALTLIPWLSTLSYQLAHTGTPWGDPVVPWFAFAEGLVSFAGGDESAEAFVLLLPLLLLPLLALFAAPIDGRRVELDLRTRPAVRWELTAAVAILLFGASVSWVAGSAFEGRYASVMFPLVVLAVAYGLTAFADRRVRTVVLAITVLLSFASAARNVTEERTQAAQVADIIKARAEPDDLVVYCPDQIGPDVSRLLEGEPLRHATFPDAGQPERVDWVDYQDRIAAADPVAFAQSMLERAGDSTVWYVSSGGYNNVAGVCELMATAFANSREPSTPVLPDDEFFELMGLTVFRGMSSPRVRRVDLLILAALSYIPFLLSSPGRVSGDTKQYLYLDPGRLLSRAVSVWDPHVGTGTVPHQNIGYVFPLGPYYWVMDQVGVPDWVAQRLFLGTISFAAAAGALWLFTMLGTKRVGAVVGALVYLLAPYQLAFTARLSVLLLPWAGLPWLIGLTIRAARRGSWRDPALFALVIVLIGSTNASSLLFVGIAPILWLVVTCAQRDLAWRRALAVAGRIALLSIGVSLWWVAGLRTQATFGIPVLDVTENLKQVADASRPADLLRGFGNWFLSGGDRVGSWLDQAPDYADSRVLAAATLFVPLAGLAAAAFVRWKHRVFLGSLVVVGTIVGVGAWPYDEPSVVGEVFKSFAGRSAAGAALRNTPRVGPVIVLGLAGLIAAGIAALSRRRALQLGAAVTVVAVVALAFLPVWRHGYFSERIERDEDVPAYWGDVATALDEGDDGTRALELPGSLFGAYRWGNTVDPITPGLTDREWVARELMPFGTRGSVDLLAALDRRLQHGTFEPESLAPVLRMLGVGTVVARNDLEYERYDSPRPRDVWQWLTDPLAPGLEQPTAFGSTDPNVASIVLPLRDEIELRSKGAEWPPKVALFDVEDARPIVSTASPEAPLVLAGDGEGVVDVAAAGFLGGDGILLYGAALDDEELAQALDDDGDLVVTDTNRRRARRWNRLRDDVGFTERAGQEPLAEDVDDFRYEITDSLTDDDRTIVEQRGGRVDATAYGDKDKYVPSERPALAFDNDLRTAWRTAGGRELDGDRLVLQLDEPVRTDAVTFVQPADAARLITEVRVQLDDGEPIDVALDESSRTPEGQRIEVPAQRVRTLTLEPLATGGTTQASVGFADVRLSGDRPGEALVDEVVRVPTRLLRRAGTAAAQRDLGYVFTRSRYDAAERGGFDEELALVREFDLPESATGGDAAGRAFELSGTARVAANAPDDILDSVLGTTTPGAVFRASGHRAGDADARASRGFDGDVDTAWDSPFAIETGEWLEAELDGPTTVQGATLRLVTDGLHSVPTRVRVEADGQPVAAVDLPAVVDTVGEGSTQEVPFEFGPVSATTLRFVVEGARIVPSLDDRTLTSVAAPVGVAELAVSGVPQAPVSAPLPDVCRDDLVRLDGEPLAVRMTAESGLEACAGAVQLDAGTHEVRARPGLDTGIDVDRFVLTSGADGAATPIATFAESSGPAGARVRVVDEGATTFDLKVRSDGEPFWLVLGQSLSDGWKAELDGESLGEPRLVNGYANGWLVDPGEAGTYAVTLRWTPQNVVWIAMALSVLAILVCLGVVLMTRRAEVPIVADEPELADPRAYGRSPAMEWRATAVTAAIAGVASALASRWWIGVLVAGGTVVAARVRGARPLLTAGAPLALVVAKATDVSELGWLAVLLFAADLLIGCVSHPRIQGSGTQDRDQALE